MPETTKSAILLNELNSKNIYSEIENLILKNYEPEFFSVIDVSEQHRGHQNFRENSESHFEIIIVSEKFKNLNRIERHRMVNKSLREEFLSNLHSVIIKTYTLEEYKSI